MVTKRRIEFGIYLIGIFFLTVSYELIKSSLESDWMFILVVVAYLLLVRVVGSVISKHYGQKTDESMDGDDAH
jgi:Kef-type K+ transport system membrane component KefB